VGEHQISPRRAIYRAPPCASCHIGACAPWVPRPSERRPLPLTPAVASSRGPQVAWPGRFACWTSRANACFSRGPAAGSRQQAWAGALADRGCRLILHSRKREQHRRAGGRVPGAGSHRARPGGRTLTPGTGDCARQGSPAHLRAASTSSTTTPPSSRPGNEEMFTTDADEYTLSFQVNTIAPITLCNLILRGMIARKFRSRV